jgi:predicted phosphate transport protein (TIGR00153 family)
MAFRLIPKEESFFDLFEAQVNRLVEASGVLVEATERFETLGENAKRLERLEHDADQLTHEIMERLNKTFITPIDREDIHRLATDLDDVMDLMEAVTERFILFKVQQMLPQAKEIAKVIQQQLQEMQRMIPHLRRMRRESIMPHCVEINRLENTGDRLLRTAFAALFDGSYEPLVVIKWRELYGLMEEATDKCEDVANVIESIVLKHA